MLSRLFMGDPVLEAVAQNRDRRISRTQHQHESGVDWESETIFITNRRYRRSWDGD